jgi:hypothetical protein
VQKRLYKQAREAVKLLERREGLVRLASSSSSVYEPSSALLAAATTIREYSHSDHDVDVPLYTRTAEAGRCRCHVLLFVGVSCPFQITAGGKETGAFDSFSVAGQILIRSEKKAAELLSTTGNEGGRKSASSPMRCPVLLR